MQSQWELQKLIMARYRSLGIVGHLPAFGGFAPWALAVAQNDSKPHSGASRGKIGKDYDTAWIDGRDPLFTRVADAWMAQIIADFGSDHAWQMDAFFANVAFFFLITLCHGHHAFGEHGAARSA